MRVIVVTLVLAALVAGGTALYRGRSGESETTYRTAAVQRGNLEATISATGVLQPEEVIDVGAQVAGQIITFGQDEQGKAIDYGSEVEEGMVLARIDDSLYAAEVAQASAAVEHAKSGVTRARADLEQFRARLDEAEAQWKRAQRLQAGGALTEIEYINYKSAYDVARANVAVGEAAILQAEKTVTQAQATLQRAQRNLSYSVIKSPVKGVIIDRRVNIGQTVVASLNAPSLFLLAKDLRRMEVWVAVNEADIGNIRANQAVRFTVDAFPGQTFTGTVNKVRLNASMTQNVVTYTVEVTTDNSNGTLLPYLTANVEFLVDRRENVLMVPSAALRYRPSRDGAGEAPASQAGSATSTVWVKDAEGIRPIHVSVGLTNGAMTEVRGDGLQEGMQVITVEQRQLAADSSGGGTGNPFTPQIRRGSGQTR